jgi:RNA polymerase sigma-70 factor (ECF subfamily)
MAEARGTPTPDDDLRLRLLVMRCQVGDEGAFARLFDEFAPRTLRHLRGLVGDASADDVQQEVWLTVYRSVSGLANPGAFRTWLFRTTRHRALDWLRRQRREAELTDELLPSIDVAVESSDDDDRAWLDAGGLDAAIARLPPLQREAVLLRYRDGLSYADIALVAGCPIGTVRTRLHHAKRNLHELLERGHV